MRDRSFGIMIAVLAILALFATVSIAQDTTQTTTSQGPATKDYKVERGEVVYVSGDQLVVRMENGEIRNITVPPGATAVVDGKTMTIADVKPGMRLQKTITTTTTPQLITTIRTIQGTVWHVAPPKTVILTLGTGENKKYNIPKGQKFMVEGEEKTAFDLRKGMKVTATVITKVPETLVAEEKKLGQLPPPPATPPMEGALLIEAGPAAPVETAQAEPAKLPKTATFLPLIGFLGLGFTLIGLGLNRFKK